MLPNFNHPGLLYCCATKTNVSSCPPKYHLVWAIIVPVPRALMYLVDSGTLFSWIVRRTGTIRNRTGLEIGRRSFTDRDESLRTQSRDLWTFGGRFSYGYRIHSFPMFITVLATLTAYALCAVLGFVPILGLIPTIALTIRALRRYIHSIPLHRQLHDEVVATTLL